MKQFFSIPLAMIILAGCSKAAPEQTIADQKPEVVAAAPAAVQLSAKFTIENPDEVKEGFVATFDNASTGAVKYEWDFGTGETSDQKNPTYIFLGCGPKIITLTVTDSAGNKQAFSIQLEVHCTGKHVPTGG
jgi:PKD repeat protein